MSKRFNHVLKPNEKTETWRHLLFFDTETRIKRDDAGNEEHTLRLGWTCHVRRDTQTEDYYPFTRSREFWELVEQLALPKQKLVVISHNLFFDLCQVEMFQKYWLDGWDLKSPCIGKSGYPFYFTMKKKDKSILFLDSLNLLPGSLRSIAESLGMKKGEPDFDTVTESELSEYCKEDCRILKTAVIRWLDFLVDNDLGNVQRTLAGQAMNAFRHRFMSTSIYLHTHPQALRMELDSYHGGRCEVFKVGKFKGEFYKLDINSMYPSIMRQYEMPTRLCGFYASGVSKVFLKQLCEQYHCIARVELFTNEGAYGHVVKKRLCFPVGTFTETLSQGSLLHALKAGHIHRIHSVAVYEKEVLFGSFVDYFWKSRLQAKDNKDAFLTYAFKILMNSLYGKFGQKAHDTVVHTVDKPEWFGSNTQLAPANLKDFFSGKVTGSDVSADLSTNVPWHVCSLFGDEIWSRDIDEQDSNAFCAIASAITDFARIYLWKLINIAGLANVFYVDTDSLIVSPEGKDRLTFFMGSLLGQLKEEGYSQEVTIHAPKDYEFDGKATMKGIKANAKYDPARKSYKQAKWTRIKGYLKQHQPDVYRVQQVYKTLKREIQTKVVNDDGSTFPLRIAE